MVKSGVMEKNNLFLIRVACLRIRVLWNEDSHKTLNPFVLPIRASTS